MKHFFTLIALLTTSLAFGQEECCALMDYNGDRNITISDFTIFLSNYGDDGVPQASSDCILCYASQVFDADQQGEIGLSDLLIMLSLFGAVDVDSDLIWDSTDQCFDMNSCNFMDVLADECIYPDVFGICGGQCMADNDEDGICDDVDGCSDSNACNFMNPASIECIYQDVLGICGGSCDEDIDGDFRCDDIDNCTDFDACNYLNPGACACSYEETAGGCLDPSDIDGDGVCDFLDACVDLESCNYAAYPTVPCIYPTLPCACDLDSDGDGICDDEDDCLSVVDECGDPVNYQGYDYATVLIGELCWFAENLRSENYGNGESIPSNLSNYEWQNRNSGAVAVYDGPIVGNNEDASNLETYGRLYNWYAVDDARGLCPCEWHVPTDGEWTVLIDHLGGASVAAVQMKTTYGWINGSGTNSSGFSGLPGGFRSSDGYSSNAGFSGVWWSSTPNGSYAWARYLSTNYESVGRDDYDPRYGLSVRCVRDAE